MRISRFPGMGAGGAAYAGGVDAGPGAVFALGSAFLTLLLLSLCFLLVLSKSQIWLHLYPLKKTRKEPDQIKASKASRQQ